MLGQELRLAYRRIVRAPRFAITVVATLGIGLGAGATLFTLVDDLLLRPPSGITDPDRVARFVLHEEARGFGQFTSQSLAWVDYRALTRASGALEGAAAWFTTRESLGRGPDARRITITAATGSFFQVLGVHPVVGRLLEAQDDQRGARAVPCVGSYEFWRGELGGGSDALGRTFRVGALTCTLVGVAPAGFTGLHLGAVDLWVPIQAWASVTWDDPELWTSDRSHWLRLAGRLRPGVTPEQAGAQATAAYRTRSLTQRHRDRDNTGRMAAEPANPNRGTGHTDRVKTATWLAGAAAGFLLLIAANLASLLLARNLAGSRDAAVRLALGGGAGQLFLARALEVGLLALGAGVVSLVAVVWLGPIVRSLLLPGVRFPSGPLDLRVGGLAVGLALVIGLSIAAIASLGIARVDPAALLNAAAGSRSTGGAGGSRARFVLVAVQAALSIALLAGSGAFVLSLRRAAGVDLGFRLHGLAVANIPVDVAGYDQTRSWDYWLKAREAAAALPGVQHAALGYMTPWQNNRSETVAIPGRDSLPMVEGFGSPAFDAVTPDYLATLGLRLRTGRWISAEDRAGSAPVIVVNEALAELYWPGEQVLGRCLRIGSGEQPCREVVGVVANHRFSGRLDRRPIPAYFLPLAQAAGYGFTPRLFVRTGIPPAEVVQPLRRLLQGLAPGLPAASVQPLSDFFDPLVAPWRLGAYAFSAFGVLAAVVAVVGLFSVLAYLVVERAAEFALRAALGARPAQVARPVLRRALFTLGVGLAAGSAVTVVANRWVEPLLFHTRLSDPLVLAAVAGGFLAVALAASLIPARQAAQSDPMTVLRAQ